MRLVDVYLDWYHDNLDPNIIRVDISSTSKVFEIISKYKGRPLHKYTGFFRVRVALDDAESARLFANEVHPYADGVEVHGSDEPPNSPYLSLDEEPRDELMKSLAVWIIDHL